eukprot:m.92832 g.92832  ORF g.92832 m.92832 type:complete len:462 (-) comp20251_c1_seq2:4031-5416(-)
MIGVWNDRRMSLPLAVVTPLNLALEVAHQANPVPPSKSASVPLEDDVSEEHPAFQAVHHNDLPSAKRAFKTYGTAVSNLLASQACRHDRLLHRAVRCGWIDIVSYLLTEVRFPVNAIKPDGATALFLAAQEGHSALALLLIDAGAQIDLPDEDGISPLYIACYQGHQEVVDTLLKAGADPNKLGLDGTSPTFIAAQEGYAGIVRSLALAGAKIDQLDHEGTAPLLMASQEGRVAAVSVLLALGAKANTMTPRGVRPLHSASQNGHLRIVQLLLAYGGDPSLTTQSGAPAVKLATDFGHAEVAAWLTLVSRRWSTLRVCAEARLHWVAAAMFSSGEADSLLAEDGTSVLLCKRATSSVTLGGLVGEQTKCRVTARLFAAALQPWRPKNHKLFGPQFRKLVVLLLLVRNRLGYGGDGRAGSPTHSTPLLPIEMWLSILSHVPRRVIDGVLSSSSSSSMAVILE